MLQYSDLDFPDEILSKIALYLGYTDTLNFCTLDIDLNFICNDSLLWKKKNEHDFRDLSSFTIVGNTAREMYLLYTTVFENFKIVYDLIYAFSTFISLSYDIGEAYSRGQSMGYIGMPPINRYNIFIWVLEFEQNLDKSVVQFLNKNSCVDEQQYNHLKINRIMYSYRKLLSFSYKLGENKDYEEFGIIDDSDDDFDKEFIEERNINPITKETIESSRKQLNKEFKFEILELVVRCDRLVGLRSGARRG